jgi:AcrR family transcriptional regulator
VYSRVYTWQVVPPSAAPRQLLARADRAASILRGAATAFARSGYAATSMEDVAAASGITKLIVYRHFESKEELYRSVLARVSDRLAEEFSLALESERPGGVGARALLTVAREDPDGFVLLWRHAAREPHFADYAAAQRALAVDVARSLQGETRGDEVLRRWEAEVVVSWLVEAVLAWVDVGEPERDEELLDLVSDGLRAMRAAWSVG